MFLRTASRLGAIGLALVLLGCDRPVTKDELADRYTYEIGQIDGHTRFISASGCTSSPVQFSPMEINITCYVVEWNSSTFCRTNAPVYSGVGTYFKRMEKEKPND